MKWVLLLAFWAGAVAAEEFALPPLPPALAEAQRLDRNQMEDQVPAGLHVQAGDALTVTVGDLAPGASVALVVGFRPMWHGGPGQQVVMLTRGEQVVLADREGPVFLRHNGLAGGPDALVNVTGGAALPVWTPDQDLPGWQAELAELGGAPFVQFLGDRALITLPMTVAKQAPVADPAATMAEIDAMLARMDELSGLDGSAPVHMPTPLRMHYLVDLQTRADDPYYMYATDGFIGMRPDNTDDLTDPATLRREWAIWHETGHIHQPWSWTWGALTEINVNVWSLYMQEAMGLPSRLDVDDGWGVPRDLARDYLANGAPDYLIDDGDTLFIRLVMLDELRAAYGWKFFVRLNQLSREDPLPWEASDQDKVDRFIGLAAEISGHDLRGYFARWGLRPSPAAEVLLAAEGRPGP